MKVVRSTKARPDVTQRAFSLPRCSINKETWQRLSHFEDTKAMPFQVSAQRWRGEIPNQEAVKVRKCFAFRKRACLSSCSC